MGLLDSALFGQQGNAGLGGLLQNILQTAQINPTPSAGFDQTQDMSARSQAPLSPQNPFAARAQFTPGMPPQTQQPQMPQAPAQPSQQDAPLLGNSGIGGLGPTLSGLLSFIAPRHTQGLMQQQQLQQQQQALNTSYQALKSSGVPDSVARAAALNPEILKTIAPAYFDTAPKLQKTGTDPLSGQDSFSVWRQNKGTLTPLQGQGGQTQAGSAPGLADFSNAIQNGVTGEALYDYVPPQMRNVVKGMVEGRQQPPTGAAMRSPQTMALIDMAHSIDPTFDSGTWGARFASQKDFSSGKSSEMVRAANQTMHHVGALLDSMDNLKNGSYPLANAAGNLWNTKVLGKGAVTEFLPNAHAVAEEMSKVFKGANLSDAEVRQWEQSLNENMSPEQQRAAVGKLVQLLNGSLQALQDKRERGMGPIASGKLGPVLNDESQKVMDRVSKWVAGDPLSQKAAAAPADGATATNPQTGKKIILKGGQWVPLQ